MPTIKIDRSIHTKIDPITLDMDSGIDHLIDQLQKIRDTVINPVIYESGSYDSDYSEFSVRGYRLLSEHEIKVHNQQKERAKLAAAKRKLSQKEKAAAKEAEKISLELKELERLAKKHNVVLPPIPKPAPENVMKTEGSQRILRKEKSND